MFNLKENGTNVPTEIAAGLSTFIAMAYIIVINPGILSQSGMEWGAVFLATIISSIIGTLIMGLFANVPYAQAPGMGLSAFFVYTACFALKFTWQEALTMVFICGLINITITATSLRRAIIRAFPESLQNAIGGGIGIFVAYIGLLNIGFINFDSGVPALSNLGNRSLLLFLIGLFIIITLTLLNVRGAMLIGIIAATLIGIPMGVTVINGNTVGFMDSCRALPSTFGVIFTDKGFGSLFSDVSRLPLVLITIFAFSLSDTFDTIGTFIGTGRKTGIFNIEDEMSYKQGGVKRQKSKLEKALYSDAIATSVGAVIGTSNTTTYVESVVGIGVGGRTGLTSVVTAICFAVSSVFASVISAVPFAATAPALVVVGIMMISSFGDIDWKDFDTAIPAFFAGIFMALCYSISYGIAAGFIFYCLVKTCRRKANEVHPIMWIITGLFIANFVFSALV
ncbi:MAG: NCS2 family permease [Oscillospiraceae bacterium]|nr:NCS2 family permease [Oscillospiraceae bacterium]